MCIVNHHTNLTQTLFITIKEYYENKYFCDFLYSLIKPKSTEEKYMITASIPKLLLKNFIFIQKRFFALSNIKMINLPLDELRLMAQLKI